MPADAGNVAATLDERGALGVLNAINEHEIAVGNQAIEKGVTGDVADYAKLMIQAHTENRDQTAAFGPDAQNKDAMAQKDKGSAELASLDKLSGEAYAKAYMMRWSKAIRRRWRRWTRSSFPRPLPTP